MAKKKTRSHIPQQMAKLPRQAHESIVLYNDGDPKTVQSEVESIINAVEYREGLVKFKTKFCMEIQEWSRRYGVEADIRVLFTLKNKLKL